MYANFQEYLKKELAQIEADGLYKRERIIESAQALKSWLAARCATTSAQITTSALPTILN